MDKKLQYLLEEDMKKEAEQIMAEVEADPVAMSAEVPEGMYEELMQQIAEYEVSQQDAKTLVHRDLTYKKKRKWRWYVILAAALVLLLAGGVTTVGEDDRVFEKVKWMLGGKEQTNIDTDDEKIGKPEMDEEAEAYQTIEMQFGFYPVGIDYLPQRTQFSELILLKETKTAKLIYTIDERVSIIYWICLDYQTRSIGPEAEEDVVNEYDWTVQGQKVNIKKYRVEETGELRWLAEFEHRDTWYFLRICNVDEREMKKIVENLYFY